MTFQNAISSLRSGKCAKTTDMRGYVKREDYTPEALAAAAALAALVPEFSPASSYSAGQFVKVTDTAADPDTATVYRFNQSHSGAWNADHVDAATAVYAVTFVENDSYVDPDSRSEYPFLVAVAAGAAEWFGKGDSDTGALVLDPELMKLFMSTEWSVFDTADVQAAIVSTKRW